MVDEKIYEAFSGSLGTWKERNENSRTKKGVYDGKSK